jgi:hypothetical protein
MDEQTEIAFRFVTEVLFDHSTDWPVGECSRCGALVRDAGTTTERHIRWHQANDRRTA